MPYPPIFNKRVKGKGAAKRLAEIINALYDFANNFHGMNGVDIQPNAFGSLDFYVRRPGGYWTGVVWFGNTIVKDYSKVDGDPEEDADPDWVNNNVTGKYLGVNLITGACSFVDDVGDYDEADTQAFWVADRFGDDPYTYRLNFHTQGDIHGRAT